MKFLSNFDQDIDGKVYKAGDPVEIGEGGTRDYLVKVGKITALDDGDADVTAVGESGEDAGDQSGVSKSADAAAKEQSAPRRKSNG